MMMMMMMRRRTAVVQGGQEIGKEQKQEEEEGKDVTKTRRVKGYHHHHLLAAWDEKWVWRLCLAFRLMNAMLVQTYFNPDEHWQALEVAHRIAFGYGHLTWEWQQGLRSYLHPLLFAALYKLLTTLHLDTPWFMTKAPRLLQSVFAAVGDVYLYKFSRNNFGERVAQWTMFCQMFNWFTFFCIVRTFSNCLETVLTTMALFYWWPVQSPSTDHHHTGSIFTSRQLGLLLAGVACIIRPTSAIIWVYVGVVQLLKIPHKLQFLLSEVFPIGIICLCAMGLVDSWMYGKWTPVLLNFFRFNFLTSGASFYGRHSWHWYFSQGLPAMAFTFLPFTLIGILWSKQWALAGLIAWVLALYSILGHKEFRFILPVLPIVMMYAGYAMAVLEQQGSSANSKEETAYSVPSSTSSGSQHQGYEQKKPTGGTRQGSRLLGGIIIFLLLTNIPLALYTSMFHQRGAEAVMEHLGQEAHAQH
ncbi:hypothetical protein BDL97_18G009300 [Sphagnum fallax]|nr:hypothetical protein BDL97_18G009300 [Sphagnum fallax]